MNSYYLHEIPTYLSTEVSKYKIIPKTLKIVYLPVYDIC